MEKTSNYIAQRVSLSLNLDKDAEEVIAYGTFAILQTFISILLILLLGIVFNAPVLSLIIYLSWSILRKYTGGVHASNSLNCLILGTIICITYTFLIQKLGKFIDLNLVVILGFSIFSFSFFLVQKFAPCEDPNKPIRSEIKKIEARKKANIFLEICISISILLIFLYKFINFKYGLIYTLGIYAGITFQIFTLTPLGHLFINKIDSLLSKTLIFFIRR